MIVLLLTVAEVPYAYSKKRHWSSEISSESPELRGRVKFIVITPFSTVATAFVMSWLESNGGSK